MFLDLIKVILSKITFFTGVINNSSYPKPLSIEEEKKAIEEMQKGSKEARDKLISHNMRLVAHMVKKYSGSAENDDLISVGSIGLIKAVNTYNLSKGTCLATFAARCIENEILMLLRANKKYKNDMHLSDSVGTDKDGNELTIMDLLFENGDSVLLEVDKNIEHEKFKQLLKKTLSSREYTVICLRYGIDCDRNYAQREVAKYLHISRSYISRIEKKAIEKLKESVKNKKFNC